MSTSFQPSPLLPEVKANFIKGFYAVSDDPTKLDDYVAHFTPDAEVKMGIAPSATGAEGIRKLRSSMWSVIATRHHRPMGVYVLDAEAREVMVYGDLDLGLKNGERVYIQWSGRIVFGPGPDLKMSFYQVYMDTGPIQAAAKK